MTAPSPELAAVAGQAGRVHLGRVRSFDEARGLGLLESEESEHRFHATAISDGTRAVRPGTEVAFLLERRHGGELEAVSVTPLLRHGVLDVEVARATRAEASALSSELEALWGPIVVARGEEIALAGLDLLAARAGDRLVGGLSYRIELDSLEVVTIDAFVRREGVGSALLAAAVEIARTGGLRRLWLVTTNANLRAISFYLRSGLRLCAVHQNAVSWSRIAKPAIPEEEGGIALCDELEFELVTEDDAPPRRGA